MTSIALDTPTRGTAAPRAVALWLLACAAMVFAMAVIGAVTRLTESGLSIVEWAPLIGALPPLSDAEWQRLFALYRETPQFHLTFHGQMTLAQFQEIFFWEWLHRLWGRLIGVVFAVPFLWFWLRGRIPRPFLPRLWVILALGAAQGALGWYMVMSGLVDRPSVSHYRLAAHLGLAVLVYALLIWVALGLLSPRHERLPAAARALAQHTWAAVALVAVAMTWGALVAGLDAGLGFNTWPLMDGQWLPPEAHALSPSWLNLVETPAMVQFVHRWLGAAVVLVALVLAWRVLAAKLPGRPARLALAVGLVALIQGGLGIATLLLYVPTSVAAAHQAGALALLTVLLWLGYALRQPRASLSTAQVEA